MTCRSRSPRRSSPARPKKPAEVAVQKKIAKRLPVDQARANKVAALVFGAFLLSIGIVVLVALDIPAKAERAAGLQSVTPASPSAAMRSRASATWTASWSTRW